MKYYITLLISLILIAFQPNISFAQNFEEYVNKWKGKERARFVTYGYNFAFDMGKETGYVSDRPYEWSWNLGPVDGNNVPVDPFFFNANGDTTAKHVLIMVHGYGAPFGGGRYFDREEEFFTHEDYPFHETGATAWFDPMQTPSKDGYKLYSYLRQREAEFGFDPKEWVVLATTLNVLPQGGEGLSILENTERLRELVDALWGEYHPYIKTISFVSHSTGSLIVKSMLGERGATYANTHPWIAHVDDHINLAGPLSGTPSVLYDPIAMDRGLGQQLLYGIQHPDDYLSSNLEDRYTASQTVYHNRYKKTYRWPSHVNVLSVAGVWSSGIMLGIHLLPPAPNQQANGNPWSYHNYYHIPNPTFTIFNEEAAFIGILSGKTDGVVPSRSVIEWIDYSTGLPQISPDMKYEMDFNIKWILPQLSTKDGGGKLLPGLAISADSVPEIDRFPGERVTYVEVEAEHNGMLNHEMLFRLIKRRLGATSVTHHVNLPEIESLSENEGPVEGGNQITITGKHFKFVRFVKFGDITTREFEMQGPDKIKVTVPDFGEPKTAPVAVVNTAGESNLDFEYTFKPTLPPVTFLTLSGDPDGQVKIELSSSVPDAEILYTWRDDIKNPDSVFGTLYTVPISVPVNPFTGESGFSLKARAFHPNFIPSATASQNYRVGTTASEPKISIIYPNIPNGTVEVRMETETPNVQGLKPTIFYTLDGSAPDINSEIYNNPIELGIGEYIIKAVTFQFNHNISSTATENITVYSAENAVQAPVMTPFSSQAFAKPIQVKMSSATEGAEIRYTMAIDGGLPEDPTATTGTVYNGPINFNQPGSYFFIKARAFKAGQAPSAIVQSGQLTHNVPIAKAGKPEIKAAFLNEGLRGEFPEGWSGFDGGGNNLFTAGPFASLRLDHEGDFIDSKAYDLSTYPNAKLQLAIRRQGAGGGPKLKVLISGGPNFEEATEVLSDIPNTSFVEQVFDIPQSNSPVYFRFQRVDTNGNAVSGLSRIEFRDMKLQSLLVENAPGQNVFFNEVEITMENFTPNPSNPQLSLASNIVYSKNGLPPSTSLPIANPSNLYPTNGFKQNASSRLNAIAFSSFLTDSDKTLAYLTLKALPPVPEVKVDEQNPGLVKIALQSGTEGSKIYYTLDGTEPTTSSLEYTGTIQIEGGGIYQIIARTFKNRYTTSEAVYVEGIAPDPYPPYFTILPDDVVVEEGDTLSLLAQAKGVPLPSYQWYKNGGEIQGADQPFYSVPAATLEDAGEYKVLAINSEGEVEGEATVTVEPMYLLPEILQQPIDFEAYVGGGAEFTVSAKGKGNTSYQWYKDGEEMDGANAATLTIPQVALEDAGQYHAKVFNEAGEVLSQEAGLTVLESGPAAIVEHPEDTSAFEGGIATFKVEISGEPTPNVRWLKDGEEILGQSTSELEIYPVSEADEGEYLAIAYNPFGQDTSTVATLTLLAPEEGNQPPTLADILVETYQNTSVLIDVLSHADDPDGDEVAIAFFTQPLHGLVTLEENQQLLYTPEQGFEGTDSLEVTVEDGKGGFAKAIVTIQILEGEAVTGLVSEAGQPLQIALHPIYPNPLSNYTKMAFDLPYNGFIALRIYNSLGQLMATLVDGNLTAGSHEYTWEPSYYTPSGVYICTLDTGKERLVRRMVLEW